LSKLLIPDDSMSSRAFFRKLEERFTLRTVDLFASGANDKCEKFYSLHWCRGTTGVNERVRVQLGRGVRLDQLPPQIERQGVAEAAHRRSNCDVARSGVGVGHLVDALGAGRDIFR
jgi:hypothetical protein